MIACHSKFFPAGHRVNMPTQEFRAIAVFIAWVAMLCISIGAIGFSCGMIGKSSLAWPTGPIVNEASQAGMDVRGVGQFEPTTRPSR